MIGAHELCSWSRQATGCVIIIKQKSTQWLQSSHFCLSVTQLGERLRFTPTPLIFADLSGLMSQTQQSSSAFLDIY